MKKKTMTDSSKKTAFHQGMTLDQYLNSIKVIQNPLEQQEEKSQEDLYETSRKMEPLKTAKITTFEIKQTDEDNYEEDKQDRFKFKASLQSSKSCIYEEGAVKKKTSKHQTESTQNTNDYKEKKHSGSSLRVKCLSKSPPTWRKSNNSDLQKFNSFSQTLHIAQHCKSVTKTQSPSLASAFYSKVLKNKKTDKMCEKLKQNDLLDASKQKGRTKHLKTPKSVQKKQKMSTEKSNGYYLPQIICMRVEGVSDRLYQRKVFIGKKMK